MKFKYFLLIAIAAAMWQAAQAQPESDTVWTKNIWPETVARAMFSRDGSKVFVSTNAQVRVYDTQTGDSLGVIPGVGSFIAYSPDSMYIYTSTAYKLDAQTFEVVGHCEDDIFKRRFQGSVQGIALTGDGKYLILSTNLIYEGPNPKEGPDSIAIILDVSTFKTVKAISEPGIIYGIDWIATSPDGKYFVTSTIDGGWGGPPQEHNNFSLILWDAQTFEKIKTIFADTIPIGIFKFTPDSKYLAMSTNGSTGRPWNVLFYETNNFIKSKITKGTLAFTFTKDSKYIITVDGTSPVIYNIDNGELFYQYKGWGADYLDISPEENYFIAGIGSGLTLYNLKKVSISDDKNKNTNIGIFPNPNDGIVNIIFDTQVRGKYKIEIFDNSGRAIYTIFDDFLDIGNQKFKWNTTGIANGILFCRISGNNLNLIYKIIISK